MLQDTLDQFIEREAIPFAVDVPDRLQAAVDRVLATLGDQVKLLGLGEALHGGEEILALRNQLFQRLVEAHGFSAIAIESSFTKGCIINEYVQGQGSQSYAALQESGFSHNFGKLEANHELVEWMRQYNLNTNHQRKIHFYGFDSPTEMMVTDSPRQVLHFALEYLTALAPQRGQERQRRIDALLGADAGWENPAAALDPSQAVGRSAAASALRIETEELITDLRIHQPEWVARSSPEQFDDALHYAGVARLLLTYHAGLADTSDDRLVNLLGMRDLLMSDTLAFIVAREHVRGKVLAFAHNRHLQRGKAEMQLGPYHLHWWPAGSQLNQMFGPRYTVIGTGVGVSEENGIGRPEPGTLEARLTASPGPARFLPTRRGQVLSEAVLGSLPNRSESQKNKTYFALGPDSFSDFDWLAVLDSITYTRGGLELP